jgi:hypothetical protein
MQVDSLLCSSHDHHIYMAPNPKAPSGKACMPIPPPCIHAHALGTNSARLKYILVSSLLSSANS